MTNVIEFPRNKVSDNHRICCALICNKKATKKLHLIVENSHLSFPVYKYFCDDCAPDGVIDHV